WSSGRRAASVGGTLEQRWAGDRVSLSGNATMWAPLGDTRSFRVVGLRAAARSSAAQAGRAWQASATVGAEPASGEGAMSLWPGAGDGRARAPRARAHPLLRDGAIELVGQGRPTVFGRSVQYTSVEGVGWLPRPQLARVGLAAFIDAARSSRSMV